jgi:hypothetical protein
MAIYGYRQGLKSKVPNNATSGGSKTETKTPIGAKKTFITESRPGEVVVTEKVSGKPVSKTYYPKGFSGAAVKQISTTSKTARYGGSADSISQSAFQQQRAKAIMSARGRAETAAARDVNRDISIREGSNAGEVLASIKRETKTVPVSRESLVRGIIKSTPGEREKREISLYTGVSRGVQPTTYEEYKIERGERAFARKRAKERTVKGVSVIIRPSPYTYSAITKELERERYKKVTGYYPEELQIPRKELAAYNIAKERASRKYPFKSIGSFGVLARGKPYADKVIDYVYQAGRKKAVAYDSAFRELSGNKVGVQFYRGGFTGSMLPGVESDIGYRPYPNYVSKGYDFFMPRNSEEVAAAIIISYGAPIFAKGLYRGGKYLVKGTYKGAKVFGKGFDKAFSELDNIGKKGAYKGSKRLSKAAIRNKQRGVIKYPKLGTKKYLGELTGGGKAPSEVWQQRLPGTKRNIRYSISVTPDIIKKTTVPRRVSSKTYFDKLNKVVTIERKYGFERKTEIVKPGSRTLDISGAPISFRNPAKPFYIRTLGAEAKFGGNVLPIRKSVKVKLISSATTTQPQGWKSFEKQLQKSGMSLKEYKTRLRGVRNQKIIERATIQQEQRGGFRKGMRQMYENLIIKVKSKRYAVKTIKPIVMSVMRKQRYKSFYEGKLFFQGSKKYLDFYNPRLSSYVVSYPEYTRGAQSLQSNAIMLRPTYNVIAIKSMQIKNSLLNVARYKYDLTGKYKSELLSIPTLKYGLKLNLGLSLEQIQKQEQVQSQISLYDLATKQISIGKTRQKTFLDYKLSQRYITEQQQSYKKQMRKVTRRGGGESQRFERPYREPTGRGGRNIFKDWYIPKPPGRDDFGFALPKILGSGIGRRRRGRITKSKRLYIVKDIVRGLI